MNLRDDAGGEGGARAGRAPVLTRRSLLRGGLAGLLAAPWANWLSAASGAAEADDHSEGDRVHTAGLLEDEIVLGMSAAFSGPSRGLGSELFRGARAYFNHANADGGVGGRKIALKLYDDGYQPDPCVRNTMKLMLEDRVFLLFGYVGTPTVTRVLPLLKKFQDEQVYLFFPFTGAQPQREPPYGDFAFNLRASYRQETAGLVDNFRAGRQEADRRVLPGRRPTGVAAGPESGPPWRRTASGLPARRPTAADRGSPAP